MEEIASSSSHSYKAYLKQDGNRTYMIGDLDPPVTSHEIYRKKKYSVGSDRDMIKEDFEEMLRFFEKRSTQEVYKDCWDMMNEDVDNERRTCRTKYDTTTLQRDYLIRFWLFHMGVEDHVANAILLSDFGHDYVEDSIGLNQNLSTVNATGITGLKRLECFNMLQNAGALGSRSGKHYVPCAKNGSIYWSENFDMYYKTLYIEPLRPVATTALSHLLLDRINLLQIPVQDNKRIQYNRHHLEDILNIVQLDSSLPSSDILSALEKSSPLYVAATTAVESKFLELNSSFSFRNLATTTSQEDAMGGCEGTSVEKISCASGTSYDTSMDKACYDDIEEEISQFDDYPDDLRIFSKAKMQVLESCLGRHFEGVADALLEMVFSFCEPYVTLLVSQESKSEDMKMEKDNHSSKEAHGLSRSFDEYYFRAYDPLQKGNIKSKEANKDFLKKRKRDEVNEIENHLIDWEHILECAHSRSSENFSLSNSFSVEVHPRLPRLSLTPSLLRRVKSRTTALFCKDLKCRVLANHNNSIPDFPS